MSSSDFFIARAEVNRDKILEICRYLYHDRRQKKPPHGLYIPRV